MTAVRDYTFTLTPPDPEDATELARRARKVLAWACEGEHRIECQEVTGEAVGTVQVSFRVTNKDRWACGQLAQDLIHIVTSTLANPVNLDIESARLPPHTSRGYAYGRKKRWRAQRSS
jgi:hypothetical protein